MKLFLVSRWQNCEKPPTKKHTQEAVKPKPASNKLKEKNYFTLPGENLVRKKGGGDNWRSLLIDTMAHMH